MAMNNRLLRPRASGYTASDADARAYIAAVESADKQKLEKAVAVAINDFVVGCKTDGIWSAIKASCILMGARTLSGALTPLAGSAPTNVNFVSGDYNRKTGLVGDGSTKYLNSGRNANADPTASFHLAVYASSAQSNATDRSYIGSQTTDAITTNSTVTTLSHRNRGTLLGFGAHTSTGFIGHSRASATSMVARVAGSQSTADTMGSASTTPLFVFARSSSASAPQQYSNGRLAFYSIGESLSLANLDTRVSALSTAIGAVIP